MTLTASPYTPTRSRLAIAARHFVDPPMTQADLAAVLGCSRPLVAAVEQGTRHPSAALQEAWAAALGQPVEVVFPESVEPLAGGSDAAPTSMRATGADEA